MLVPLVGQGAGEGGRWLHITEALFSVGWRSKVFIRRPEAELTSRPAAQHLGMSPKAQ